MLTAQERGDLAQRLLPVAAQLATIVHGDGGHQDITYVLQQLDPAEKDALIVVLAGLVNPEQKVSDALSYVTWDEEGRPAQPCLESKTVRQISRIQWTPIHKPLAAPAGPRERGLVEDAEELHRQGLEPQLIADRLGVTWDRITVAYSRCRVQTPKARAAA